MVGTGVAALLRALFLWLLFILVESLQGALRHWLLGPEMEIAMRLASVTAGVAVIFAVTWFGWSWLRPRSYGAALATGALWAVLTLAFETGLGRLQGVSWDRLAADYDPRRGGFMAIGLLAMALTPWAVGRLKTRTA